MVETHYDYSSPGINYGFTSNLDLETNIRYGVIPLSAVNDYVLEDFEPDYGNPSCPNCQAEHNASSDSPVKDLDSDEKYSAFDFTAQCGVYQCTQCERVYYPMELISQLELEDFKANPCAQEFTAREGDNTCIESTTYSSFSEQGYVSPCCSESVEKVQFKHEYEGFNAYHINSDYVCLSCKLLFSNESAYPEQPYSHTYEKQGYVLQLDSQNDIWILKSPVATYAQFCSPCAPGAGYLTNPTKEGEGAFCYALDDSFFDERPDSQSDSTGSQSGNEGDSQEDSVDSEDSLDSQSVNVEYKAYRPYPLYNLQGERIQD